MRPLAAAQSIGRSDQTRKNGVPGMLTCRRSGKRVATVDRPRAPVYRPAVRRKYALRSRTWAESGRDATPPPSPRPSHCFCEDFGRTFHSAVSRDGRDATEIAEALAGQPDCVVTVSSVGGDEEPRGSGGERRFSEGPPGSGGDTGAYGPTTAARRSRSGIKKLFGELKRETCGTSNQRARKSRKRVDHQKEADFNPHQHSRN